MKKAFCRLCMLVTLAVVLIECRVSALGIFSDSNEGFISKNIELFIFFTLLTFLPMLIIMTTSFTRIVITFAFLKNASGLQNAIPSIVLVGLSIILTFFIMMPIGERINNDAIDRKSVV